VTNAALMLKNCAKMSRKKQSVYRSASLLRLMMMMMMMIVRETAGSGFGHALGTGRPCAPMVKPRLWSEFMCPI